MYRWIIIICFLFSMLTGTAAAVEPAEEEFVKEYVAAVEAKDVARLKKLVHPECLAPINDENRDYYDDYFSGEIEKSIPDNYEIIDVTAIDKDAPLMMTEVFSYPVRPTHWVQIDFMTGPYESESILRQIVKFEDTWYMVVPCPKPEAMKQFREAQIKKEEQKARAEALYQELKNPLRSELIELLKEGDKIQAWKRYSSKTGESLAMAKEVLLPLEEFVKEQEAVEAARRKVTFVDIGKRYSRLDELKTELDAKGYVFLGKFGDSWPAELKEAEKDMDGISFERSNGRKHDYTGFDGYEVLMLRLSADNQEENVVIFRSKEKK